ncbi:hypothetical protein HY745_08325 [Candidatus Desantisbacteria bacterium]|nr:hypothetical protein [Candidatus Desantisbacteria bacterium]
MIEIDVKKNIVKSIQSFIKINLSENALELFKTLGYITDRQSPFSQKTYKFFKDSFLEGNTHFKNEKAFVCDWKYVDLLFQLSKEEMSGVVGPVGQAFLPVNNKNNNRCQTGMSDLPMSDLPVNNTIIESYLFFFFFLSKPQYTRTELSQITREVNKVFPMPVMILFKHGLTLTLSIINRRLHKKDERKDVLEKVTLIKDINIENPHRAHIEILFDLSFDELFRKHKFANFVDLHKAWQKTLDTKELNKKFYQELFNWYLWAQKSVKFPQIRPSEDLIDDKVHQSESLIRLLTRLLFCWFMKEKGLIKEDLFNINSLKNILKNFQGSDSDETIYYKAILQNLFFATLSKPIADRKVITNVYPNPDYGDPLVYRYVELFKNKADILKHFENIPFLNGGLFDCLDNRKDADNPAEIRLDGFSQVKSKQPIVPDKLFFGEYKDIDLCCEYEDKKKSKLTIHGLIDILNNYN